MFTGLVQEIGSVRAVSQTDEGMRLEIACSLNELVLGESIALHGACLTVKEIAAGGFVADASSETVAKTMLNDLEKGSRVHLEQALALGARLGGHLVTGHVDGVGTLEGRKPFGDSLQVTFGVPKLLRPFVAPKGSMTVNGVSLTVNSVHASSFEVMLVPYTLTETVFGELPDGARVNLEVDVLAKYVASLSGKPGVDGSGGN